MKKTYLDFEKNIFINILKKNFICGNITLEQYKLYLKQHELAIIKFINNGIGFYFDYILPEYLNSQYDLDIVISGGDYIIESKPDQPVELILFIKKGNISCIEGHGYGSDIDHSFFENYVSINLNRQ